MALGVLGMPGFTAYTGLLEIGRPKRGETLVVAAASGPVGSVVGQIGLIMGCTVIGIAGGMRKCHYVVEELGFVACIDHSASDFAQQLAAACPQGIDIYFENVGGAVFEAVLPLLNAGARIPLCGLVAQYNQESAAQGPDRTGALMSLLLKRRVRLQGFIVFQDFGSQFEEFLESMHSWVHAGKVKVREDLVAGLERAPRAFIAQLEGGNFGKLVIRVAER
jgi:NADPH-dependent curcumin reductase